MLDDYLSGNGSEADALEYGDGGDNYMANQSPLDVIDNGQVSQGAGGTTVSSPGWMNSLGSLFQLGTQGAGVVTALSGSTTSPAATVANPTAGVATGAAATIGGMSKTTLMIIGGAVLLLGALLFLRKRH